MKSACSLCLLLLWVVLVREGASVISGPRSPRDRGQLEPRTVEAAEGEELLAEGARRLHKRQSSSNSSGIGTKAALSGDSHNQAVVHWTGYPSERIFIVTRQRTSSGRGRSAHSSESWLWRSTDYGHHFENETYKLEDGDAVIEWYYISPNQSNLIFADRSNQRLYVTTDEGESYARVDIPFRPDRLLFQRSTSPNVTDDFPLYVLGYDASNKTLWASSNLGSNWTLLGENVTPGRYYWRVMDTIIEGDLTSVYFETAINRTHAQLHYSVYPYSTHDVFDSSLGPFLINSFVLSHEYMFVQMSASTGGSYQSPLWVSHYRKPFRQARFPLQTAEMHYSVVDASEGQVFIAVYHSFNNTNLYLSEEQGLNYSLSLEYIISPPESDWTDGYPSFDVHVVEGIVGTYIANRKTPGSQYGATVISFDKGGAWNFLTPPTVTSEGAPIICSLPQCSLHLHMNSDRLYGYQSILSQDSAVGLIMAQGNLGSALQRFNYNDQRLYFSHNGGFTWQEVAQRFWQFQFAALGSVVVTVQMYLRGGVDYVRWSCDEGASWNQTSFVDTKIQVVGMLTERGEKARHVTLFGSNPGNFEWLVVDLNFTSVVPDQCSYPDDYYPWFPTDERPGSRCLLGEKITYERRDSDVCCFVDPEYDKPTNRTPCVCAIEDFECDVGFERVNLNSPCTPLPYLSWPPSAPTNCQEGGNYTYTSGYRRVAGDICVLGNETYFLPVTRQCPVVAPNGLALIYTPPSTPPGVNVTFTLIQVAGWRMATQYLWYFNDSAAVTTVMGYDRGHTQSHVFLSHGVYHVKVTVTNAAGSSQAFTDVTVVEHIQGIEVDTRPTVRSSILTTVNITVRTEGGEQYTGPLRLIAQHQNGTELDSNYWENSNGNEQLHIALSDPGSSTVVFTASNGVFVQSNTRLFLVVRSGQYGAVTLVFRTTDLPANHDTPEWKKKFVNSIIRYIQQHFGRSVELIEVESLHYYINTTLPTESPTSVEHKVLKRSGEKLLAVDVDLLPANSSDISATIAVSEQLVSEIQSGGVIVMVDNQTVAVANAILRSTQQIVIPQHIQGIEVDTRPTVRSSILTTVNITVRTEGGEQYTGPLRLIAQHQNGTELDSNYWENSNGNEQLHIALSDSGSSTVVFTASNSISVQSNTRLFLVVRSGQYGAVTLVFRTTDLPTNHDTPEWKKKLVNSIIRYIQQHFGRSVELIEVESLPYYINTTLPTESPPSVERSGEKLLAVDVDLLPANTSDISATIAVSKQLVSEIQSGGVIVMVDNQPVAVASATLRSTQQIVIVEPSVAKQNTRLYIGLGLGLGLGLILLVILSTVMVAVTYHYRRKYSRLHVRYSRLQQGPVRFSFTEHGETVQEEDFAENFSDDDPTYADDQKLEKIAPLPGAMES